MDVFYPQTQQPNKPTADDIIKKTMADNPDKEDKRWPTARAGGDEVYLLKDGEKHWIINPEVYRLLGYNFGDEKTITPAELATFKTGESITKLNYQIFLKEQKPKEEKRVELPKTEEPNPVSPSSPSLA